MRTRVTTDVSYTSRKLKHHHYYRLQVWCKQFLAGVFICGTQ